MPAQPETAPVETLDPVDHSVEQWRAEWPELDVSAMEVFGRVHRVFLHYRAHIAKVFEAHGLNAPAFGVLAALYRSGAPYRLPVGVLADQTLVSTGGMTQRLDRLEVAGLIRRERTDQDRRIVNAVLTAAGLECARAAARVHFEHESRMLHLLSPKERAELATALRLLERSVRSTAAFAPTVDAQEHACCA